MASPTAVASESRPGHAGCVRATVVRGDNLDVFVADVAVLILVFDPGVGEVDAAVEEREVVLACPGLNLFRRAVRPAVAVGPSPVPLLQELLVVTLQLVVEDDAPDVSAAGTEALLGALVRAINLGVVSQLARLPEARVERLPGLVGRAPGDSPRARLDPDPSGRRRPVRRSSGIRSRRPDAWRCRRLFSPTVRLARSSSISRTSLAWTTRNAPIVASASLSWPFSS